MADKAKQIASIYHNLHFVQDVFCSRLSALCPSFQEFNILFEIMAYQEKDAESHSREMKGGGMKR